MTQITIFNVILIKDFSVQFPSAVLLTINVPLVYIEREIMVFLWENPLRGPLQGVCHENRDFESGTRPFLPL